MNDAKAVIPIEYTSQDLRRLLIGLISLEVFLVGAHFFVFFGPGGRWKIVRLLFNLDAEESLPTWFATVQLFSVGTVLLVTAWANQYEEDLPSWFVAAGGLLFLFLSADEGSVIHERISLILRERAPANFPIPYWILLYATLGTLVVAMSAPYLPTLGRRFPQASLIALGGGTVLVLGAAGFEILSFLFLDFESTPTFLQVEIATEEFLEMSGGSVLLYAALLVAPDLCSAAAPSVSLSPPRSTDAPPPSMTNATSHTEAS